MASTSYSVILLLFALTSGQVVPHTNFPDSVAEIINHFASLESSQFNCWFLHAELELIGDIMSSPRISHIPKVFARIPTFHLNYTRKPSMLVLYANAYFQHPESLIMAMYTSLLVDHDTKYLVLAEFARLQDVEVIHNMMFAKIAWIVVFIHTKVRLAFVYNPFKKSVIYSDKLDVGIMFNDMTRNIFGTQVRFTLVGSTPWCALREPRVKNGLVQGSVGNWVTETLRRINGSWYGVQLFCDPTVKDCTRQYMYDQDGTPFDLILVSLYLQRFLVSSLDLTEPVRSMILAPRGRILEMFELFTYPFENELWTLIIALLVVCVLVSIVFPTLFQNDPILLSVCGFERYNLRLAKPHEKMIIFSLIVLFFLITNAYENKFISLMTSYPRVPDLETLEDLRRAGIKIAVAVVKHSTAEFQFPDPELQSLVEFVGDLVRHPKTMAMMAEERMARVILYGNDYIDETTGDILFMPLKGYSVNLRVNSISTVPKSPYRTKLRDSERKFFDAGLMRYWFEEMLYENFKFRRAYDLSKVRPQVDKDITVSELLPVWIVLAGGWITSIGVLAIEISWRKWTNRN